MDTNLLNPAVEKPMVLPSQQETALVVASIWMKALAFSPKMANIWARLSKTCQLQLNYIPLLVFIHREQSSRLTLVRNLLSSTGGLWTVLDLSGLHVKAFLRKKHILWHYELLAGAILLLSKKPTAISTLCLWNYRGSTYF